jgi:excisionase family DNA binding protein
VARTRLNARLAKLHRTYTVEETASLFGVHRNTVRGWLKNGLTSIDSGRPVLIQGKTFRGFLEARRAAAKSRCPPGTLYCFKCRAPRPPALKMVDLLVQETGPGNLRALCESCGSSMHRRAAASSLGELMPGIEVLVVRR